MQAYHAASHNVPPTRLDTNTGLALLPTGELTRRLRAYRALRDAAATPGQRRCFSGYAEEARTELRRRSGEIRLVAA